MDATYQEEDILTSEGIRKLKTINIIHVELKCLRD